MWYKRNFETKRNLWRSHLHLALQFTILLVINSACNSKGRNSSAQYMQTASEKKICDSLQIDTILVHKIREYNEHEVEAFHYSFSKMYQNGEETELDPIHLKGFVFSEKNANSYELVMNLKDDFHQRGYTIFLLENNYNIGNKLDQLAVLKQTDKYVILKQLEIDAANYDISNDSILSIVKHFDQQYSLELIGAAGDWCEFVIHKEPDNWLNFAKEVYRFCPDVVDQGTGSVEGLAKEMKMSNRLYLWWD